MKKNSVRSIIKALLCIGILLPVLLVMYGACATAAPGTEDGEIPLIPGTPGIPARRIIHPIIVQTPQEVPYSSTIQPFIFHYEGEETIESLFYQSPEDRTLDRFGTTINPAKVGTYYVSVRNRYEEVFAEYRIYKSQIKIEAKEIQQAFYDGDPKRVDVTVEEGIPLSFSYYPNPELRDEAMKAAEESAMRGNPSLPQSEFRGYRRIDRAPSEQGTYYVWVYFPGDENHEAVSLKLELTILPPRR